MLFTRLFMQANWVYSSHTGKSENRITERITDMTKRTAHALALVLSAMPLLIVGCGDSDNNGGTGGTIGGTGGATKYDGGGGAGGAKLDVGATSDTVVPALDTAGVPDAAPAIDVTVAVDTTVVVLDSAIPDAPIVPDAPMLNDTNALDVATPVDVTIPVDTTPAVDTTPVVCTMTTPFTGGDVTTNLTLTAACSPYTITDNINVSGNATLTIEAGVTLSMANDTEISIGYGTAGRLVANGTATKLIVFTSPTAGAGDWAGIHFWGNTITGSSISYANVYYCGQGRACIHGEGGVKTGRVTVDHVAIDHVGPNTNAITEKDTDSNFAISNCTFKGIPAAQYAISVDGESFAGIDSTNTFNGSSIELRGGDISATTTWKNPGTTVAVVVTSDLSIDGAPAPTLTIAAGTQLSFVQETGIQVGSSKGGILKIAGTTTVPVTLTSANAPAAAGDWDGIFIWGNGQAEIDNATISYGGNVFTGTSSGDICLEGKAKLTISNSKLSDSSGYGLWIRCGSEATVNASNVWYANNASGEEGPGPDNTAPACQ